MLERKSYFDRISAYECKCKVAGAIQGVWVQTHINNKNPQSYLSADSVLCLYYPSISIPFLNLNSSVPLFFTVMLSITEIHSLLSNAVMGFSVS